MTSSAADTANDSARGLGTTAIPTMTIAAAVATSTSYVLQPELHTVAGDLGASVSGIGVVASAPILGYLLGLALLVPLADRVRSNRLIAAQLSGLALSMGLAATAPNAPVLGTALLLSGLCASTGAQMSSLAGRYAPRATRGQAVGTVTAGISAGIVLGRIVGGTLADVLGWRGMLGCLLVASLALAAAALRSLPGRTMSARQSYSAVIRALPKLVTTDRRLLTSAVAGALWFFAFSLVWVASSLALAAPPISLSASRIGLYALAGLLGVAVTPFAGRLADRVGTRRVVIGGLSLSVASAVLMSLTIELALPFMVGLALFDAGLFAAQVANQSRVLALEPDRPAQYNGAYMVVYFIGGTAGIAIGATAVEVVGWGGACATAIGAMLLAMIVATRSLPAARRPHA
ncbi:MFS transporter [Solicola gregarius]|uniref:MFS transporter n=1 Tax=Solicola gregarius TaxID=2908642 RepID=A0AA46TMV7_9ACTN|nr:MFS transporter [Solicola gregarius]UYM07862.1 MFS transporter [Solicola gregarius]